MSKLLKAYLGAAITGEMAVKDIAVSSAVDIEALKSGDDDPLEVVVEIPVSQSKRGWHYTHSALMDIVNAVNEGSLHGFLGHQKAEDVPNEFPTPVTHWVGAKMEENAAYFRGIVDSTAKDLKRWIKSGVVRNVSIFGEARLAESNGETHVVGYSPLSIDWTPLERMGMPTRIVAVGEMRGIDDESNKGGKQVNPEEVLSNLKTMYGNKQVTPKMVADALGVSAVQLAGEMDDKFKESHSKSEAVLKELEGVTGEMDPVKAVKELKEKAEKYEGVQVQLLVGEMAGEKINNENAAKDILNVDTPLGKLWSIQSGGFKGDKAALSAEMDKFLEDKAVQSLIGGYDNAQSAGILSGEMRNNRNDKNKVTGARVTRASF